MVVYFDIINLVGNYMVVHELKSSMKISHSIFILFNVHVKKIKIEIHQKMIMTWIYENMAHFRSFKNP
jgi:hypothetical protein